MLNRHGFLRIRQFVDHMCTFCSEVTLSISRRRTKNVMTGLNSYGDQLEVFAQLKENLLLNALIVRRQTQSRGQEMEGHGILC